MFKLLFSHILNHMWEWVGFFVVFFCFFGLGTAEMLGADIKSEFIWAQRLNRTPHVFNINSDMKSCQLIITDLSKPSFKLQLSELRDLYSMHLQVYFKGFPE